MSGCCGQGLPKAVPGDEKKLTLDERVAERERIEQALLEQVAETEGLTVEQVREKYAHREV